MSSLNQKAERAVYHALRAALVDVDSTDTTAMGSGATWVVSETGTGITLTTGTTLDVPFHVGESEDVVTPPCVVIWATDATQDEDSAFWFVPVNVEVRIQADSSTLTPDVIAELERLSEAIADAMWSGNFWTTLSEQQDAFSCLGQTPQGTRDRSVDGRTRIHRYQKTFFCIEADIN